MAELADAAGLGPAGRKPLGVQIPLPAPLKNPEFFYAQNYAR
jgi:hypothetical protein